MRSQWKVSDGSWEFRALTPDTWKDFEALFGKRGAAGGCWCMWWRLSQKEFNTQKGEGNRRAMKAIVASGSIPGILAYHEGRPAGWCSVAPREDFPRLARSRILKPVDSRAVWSVVCFFTTKAYRRRGVAERLLRAATKYVRARGGRIVEGYPVEPKKGETADVFAYHGLASMFRNVGFREVARRSPTRPIMRLVLRA
jgi:GNAT superfamily N-acetyltransferase